MDLGYPLPEMNCSTREAYCLPQIVFSILSFHLVQTLYERGASRNAALHYPWNVVMESRFFRTAPNSEHQLARHDDVTLHNDVRERAALRMEGRHGESVLSVRRHYVSQ